jgi:hypothetical protein
MLSDSLFTDRPIKLQSITSVSGNILVEEADVIVTGSVRFHWLPFVRCSDYRKPRTKFRHDSDQIKHKGK